MGGRKMVKRSSAPTPQAQGVMPPAGLVRSDAIIENETFVVLSYPSAPHAPIAGLTLAESAVLSAAFDGLSTKEIAAARGVSSVTVQNQLARVYRKLGVSSRGEARALLSRAKP